MDRIVFHLTDADLFDAFMRGLPRKFPLEVIRRNEKFRTKYFRGYRITANSLEFSILCRAFYDEINQKRDEKIIRFLCVNWVINHSDLATTGLQTLGVGDFDLCKPDTWLPQAHDALKSRGYIDGARSVVRASGITHRLEDILIFVSILSYYFEDQRSLRSAVEEEFGTVQDNPRLLLKHLEEEQQTRRTRLLEIDNQHSSESKRLGEERSDLRKNKKKSDKEATRLTSEVDSESKLLAKTEREFTEVKARRATHKEALEHLEKRKLKAVNLSSRINDNIAKVDAELTELTELHNKQRQGVKSDLEQIEHRIDEVRERLKEAQPTPKVSPIAQSRPTAPQVDSNIETSKLDEWSLSLEELSKIVAQPGFISTPVTLELAHLRATNSISKPALGQESLALPVGGPDFAASTSWWAYHAVMEAPLWNREYLAKYALARTADAENHDIEFSTNVLLGGLYHAARVSDPTLTDLLVRRLMEIVTGSPPSQNRTVDVDDDAFGAVEQLGSNQEVLRNLGCLQTNVAAANPKAFRRLYDLMQPRGRMVAKRALASHAPQLQVQETDPTHEVLDVVSNQIGSLLGPLSVTLRAWWERAQLHEQMQNDRRLLLAATAKVMHVFSMETRVRLTRFRDLLGQRLSETLTDNTPDSYKRLSQLALEFCIRECEQPEWISSRFLFPLVFKVAQCATQADIQIRRQLKAALSVSLEKRQHPIGNTRTGIPIRISITNMGTATATDLEVLLVTPQDSHATIQNPEVNLRKCQARDTVTYEACLDVAVPLPALELECLTTWRDPSNSDSQSAVHKLKIVAQRQVNWDRARVNPYSLRSITDPGRLVGREDALDALRLGIMGTQSFYLTGQKRVGKTSVARVLNQEFQTRDTFISVYLTMGELTTNSAATLILSLCQAIAEELPADSAEEVLRTLPSQEEFSVNPKQHSRRFLKALDNYLSGKTVLCIVDDFDELDEQLYKGPDSVNLFLYLRTLIDRGNFVFVLVGSEKLPDILRHQGVRLNQVKQHNLDYILDKSALESLIVRPAAPYLEFGKAAIEQIAFFSAGNPYYATQICNRIYDDMIAGRDHFVGSADVQRSVEGICNEGTVSTFQHFWTDGIFEGSSDQKHMQYLNAAILMACATLGGRDCNPVRRSELLDETSLRTYDPAQARYRLDNMVDRGVLVLEQDSVNIRVPILATWLQGGGSAAVRASFGAEDFEAQLASPAAGISARTILEVSERLTYQGERVSELRVKAWLDQFGGQRHQELAMTLLKRLKSQGYIDEAKLYPMCKSLHRIVVQEEADRGDWAPRMERRKTTNLFVSYLGNDGKSGSKLLYTYRTANNLPAPMTGSPDDAFEYLKQSTRRQKRAVIVLIDDFVGTGGSCIAALGAFQEMIAGLRDGKKNIGLYVSVLVGFRTGLEAIRQSCTELDPHIQFCRELDSSNRAFSHDAGIFESDSDRLEAEKVCRGIGEVLEPSQPLGYGDCQALITFEHRCPNNTLPIFYKHGVRYHGREWMPLFRR